MFIPKHRAPKLPSAALLPLIVPFISESVPEEHSGSLSGHPSVSQRDATAKGFWDPPLLLAQGRALTSGLSQTLHKSMCSSSGTLWLLIWTLRPPVSPPDTELLPFRLPHFPSHCTSPSAALLQGTVYSHILQEKIWQQMLPTKICILAAVFTRERTKAFQASHCALSFCHVQLPMEEFSSGKTQDKILCPPNCSGKWAQNLGCLLTKKKHRYKRGFY